MHVDLEIMKLILIRHGETKENLNKLVQGHLPGELTERGKEQAKDVAIALKGEKIHAIFSSDLKRARDTCMEIAKYHAVPVNYTKQLRKSDSGIYSGKPKAELTKAYETAFLRNGTSKLAFKPNGGESILEVKERVQRFFESLRFYYEDKTVAIITHAEIISILAHIYNAVPIERAIANRYGHASVSIIEISKKELCMPASKDNYCGRDGLSRFVSRHL